MLLRSRKSTLALKVNIVFFLFASIMLSSTVTALYFQRGSNKVDGVRIDIAGRNRMLSQKAAFKVLLIASRSDTKANQKQLDELLNLHQSSYQLLKDGGQNNGLQLPASYTSFQSNFDAIAQSWVGFKQVINQSLTGQEANKSQLSSAAEELLKSNNKLVQSMVKEYNDRNLFYQKIYVGLAAASILVLVLGILFIRGSLVKPVSIILAYIQKQNQGQFDQRLPVSGDDEMGMISQGLNQLSLKIKQLIEGLSQISAKVLESSHALQSSATVTNENSSHQASSIEEISSSLEELEGSSELNATLSTATSKRSSNSIEQMQVLREKGGELTKSLDQINTRINVIDEISIQTNLLALNAAVEATKAGESGKGFSVISREIRQLADDTKDASQEILTLIHACTVNAKDNQELIIAQENDLHNLLKDLQSIDQASQEQRHGIQQINMTIESLNRLSQSNAQMASDLQDTSSGLSSMTKSMRKQVSEISKEN